MINIEQKDDKLLVSYFNEQNKISIDRIPLTDHMMYNYVESKNPLQITQYKAFDGAYLNRIRSRRLSKFRIMEILYQYYKGGIGKKWNTMRQPKKHFMDIETQVLTSAIPSASNPQEKIRTIAVSHEKHCVLYGSKDMHPRAVEEITKKINEHFASVTKDRETKYTFEHRFIENERTMIADFMTDMRHVSVMSGWNVLKFDWSYLCARFEFLGGDPAMSSPTKSMFGFYIADKWKKTEGTTVKIPNHLPIVDYMGLYEKLDSSISPKESSTLDWVSNEVLKVKKVKYNGSLNALYDSNYEEFCFYNAIDAILVNLIDQKLQTFNTLQALAIAGRVPLHEGYFFSDIIENLFVCEYFDRNQFFPDKRYMREKEHYKGGFVLEPDKGIHEWTMGYDAESMYPSCVLAFNLGMDTYMGTLDKEGTDPNNMKVIVLPDGNFSMQNQPFVFDPTKHIRAATGAIFNKLKSSVPRTVLVENIKERLMHKKIAMDLLVDISQLEKLRDSLQVKP